MGAQVYQTDTIERTRPGVANDHEAQPAFDWQNAQPARNLDGKALVDIQTGEKVGQVDDILFDPNTLGVAALIFSQGGLFNRQSESIPANNVQVWGKDVLLVNRSRMNVRDELPDRGQLVKLSDQLRGRYVVSTNGDRVGQIEDVLIDNQGHLAGYNLSQVYIEGRLAELKRIPVEATSSLGKDILIVDLDKIQ